MAYVDTSPLEDEDLADDSSGVETSGAPMAAGGSPAAPQAAGPGAGATGKSKTPGRFADLSEYLRVNAPQEFGTQLAGKVGGDIEQGANTLTSATNEYKSRADANTIRDNDGLTGKVSTSPEDIDADAFAKIRDAQYKGPASLSDAQDLNAQVTGAAGSAVGKANASKTEGGRFALLDNYFGKPTYSQGQKSLDNLLVQNDPKSQQAFDQMRKNAQTLQSNVNEAGVNLTGYSAQAKAATEGTRNAARGAVGIDDSGNLTDSSPIRSLYDDLTSRTNSYNEQTASEREAIQQALSRQQLTEAQLQRLGLSEGRTWGVDPSSYFHPGDDATVASYASPAEQRRIAALTKLAGVDNTFLPDETLAGTYDPQKAVSFDKSAFDNQVSGARARIEPNIAPAAKAKSIADLADQKLSQLSSDQDLRDTIMLAPQSVQAREFVSDLAAAAGVDPKTLLNTNIENWIKGVSSEQRQAYQTYNSRIPKNYLSAIRRI